MSELTCPECGPKWSGAYTCEHRCVACGSVLHADDYLPPDVEIIELNSVIDQLTARISEMEAKHEREFDEALAERDSYHEVADTLAACIERITGVDNGEHTSANCPWRNAEENAAGYADERDQLREFGDRWKDRCEATREYVEVLREENAELVAWVEQIRMAAGQIGSCEPGSTKWQLAIVRILGALGRQPHRCLAQRDAQVASDAMMTVSTWLEGGVDDHAGLEIGMEISGPTQCSEADRCMRAGARAFKEAARLWKARAEGVDNE